MGTYYRAHFSATFFALQHASPSGGAACTGDTPPVCENPGLPASLRALLGARLLLRASAQ